MRSAGADAGGCLSCLCEEPEGSEFPPASSREAWCGQTAASEQGTAWCSLPSNIPDPKIEKPAELAPSGLFVSRQRSSPRLRYGARPASLHNDHDSSLRPIARTGPHLETPRAPRVLVRWQSQDLTLAFCSSVRAGGTSRATGLPRFVMTISSPNAASSTRRDKCAFAARMPKVRLRYLQKNGSTKLILTGRTPQSCNRKAFAHAQDVICPFQTFAMRPRPQ